jgi:hypothetical protein
MLSFGRKHCSMGKASARIALYLAFLLFHPPICRGQDKLVSFFDPSEVNERQTQVAEALKLICPNDEILRNEQEDVAGCQHCPRGTAE